MTILAQLNDCHSCNDERSIVQKKGLTQAATSKKKRMPKGLRVDFGVVEERRGIFSVLRVNNVEDELGQLDKEVKQDGPWMRRGATSSVIGH